MRKRLLRNSLSSLTVFQTGDILVVVYCKETIIYRFEGICIAIRQKLLRDVDTALSIRNIVFGIGVELSLTYYFHRIYFLTVLDYKRKEFRYKKSKLYYLRRKLNRSSRVI